MALDPIFRLSNSTDQPRPTVPSRTSSLKQSQPSRADAKCTSTISPRTIRANTSGETPATSWGSARFGTIRQSLAVQDDASVEHIRNEQPIGLKRTISAMTSSPRVNMNRRSANCAPPTRSTMRTARVKRWAGLTRTVSDWDGLRRDPELWFDDGDCLVHLYARGQSRRGPSFRVPFKALRKSRCGALFSLCFAQVTPVPGSSSPASRRVSMGLTTQVSATNTCEIYIPAPEDAARDASFQWHVTTRNFFAFIFNKPLVGRHLGQALVDLQERMHLFRSGQIDNHTDFLRYADDQGYRDFVDSPDYALAMLYYAEHYQLRDIWIDAFAHCVGQNEELSLSPEFEVRSSYDTGIYWELMAAQPISRLSKALITRAYLEMDIHLGRVSVALTNFLEDDLSSAFLGLPDGARAHLDRFRSFMHSFYVEKFGYWPPPKGSSFSKSLYKSMYYDMRNVYDYLVDRDSSIDLTSQKPASGGICVLQNVQAFDERHNFTPLPQPLPLIPQHEPLTRRTQSQKTLRTLTLGSKQAKTDRYMTTRAALTTASNTRDISITSSPIVQAYMRFERQCALNSQREEKVSMADARKVRWLLVYGTLQYLISSLRAPKEVRNTEDSAYPLCCLITEQAPWHIVSKDSTSAAVDTVDVPEAINNYLSESLCDVPHDLSSSTTLTIQPDCQTDDYFTHTNQDPSPVASRPISVEVPAPLRLKSPSRRSSIRSFKPVTLSALSSRRNSLTSRPTVQSFSEIAVHAHGNGLNEAVVDQPSHTLSRSESLIYSHRSSKSILPDGAGPDTSWLRPFTPDNASGLKRPSHLELKTDLAFDQARTPIFDSVQMEQLVSPNTPDDRSTVPSSSDSTSSADSPFWSDGASSTSSKSSASVDLPHLNQSTVDKSGLLGGLVAIDAMPKLTPKRTSSFTSITPSHRSEFRFSFGNTNNPNFNDIVYFGEPRASFEGHVDIGVALSGPPSVTNLSPNPVSMAAPAFNDPFLVEEKPTSIPACLSTDSPFPIKAAEKVRSSVGQRREKAMDIFSALSLLGPSEPRGKVEEVEPRSETSRDVLAALPPPIKKTSHTKMADEDERGRKKDRRRSFGLLLRRR
ncbi:hypothetical protein BDV96DRAFT_245255 [Lophiotrema nucula]|uniref:DUF8004 domain-containing protein n=1 Tax=Lophiotrema nucula TaxID=690887 RepID=A0A6A5YT48_9PLEO|nr:hypothetical protein BDV96DRAFT_245255 [Lophiotrema nucula]